MDVPGLQRKKKMRHLVIKSQLSLCINLLFVLCIEGTLDSISRICGPVLKLPVQTIIIRIKRFTTNTLVQFLGRFNLTRNKIQTVATNITLVLRMV